MLTLTLYTPDFKVIEKQPVSEVTLPTAEGQVQILDGHADFIGLIQAGSLSYRSANGTTASGVASFGFFEMKGGNLTVCAGTFEWSTDIDVSRAKAAQLKAEEMLKSPELSEEHFKKYQAKLQRAVVRQQVGANAAFH